MNSLFQQLYPQTQQKMQTNQGSLPSRNDLLKQVLNSSNPKELLDSLLKSNPQLQNLMQSMNSSGMTPKQFFYSYAKQNGIDPNQFLNSLKN